IARVRREIGEHRRYPAMARRRGLEGVVVVRLSIDADGGLGEVSTTRKASKTLARATVDAVRRAAPFPPPPAGRLSIEIPVRYDLDG
ncbi:MAG: TonB family protein, partial [Myxococcota bacterium]|nr:TonB family protein [Myxococcota bacterium]